MILQNAAADTNQFMYANQSIHIHNLFERAKII